LLHDGTEWPISDGEIKDGVAARAVSFFGLVEGGAHVFIEIRLRQVARDVRHRVGKPRRRVFVDVVGIELRPRAADKAFQHVMKALTPAVGSTVRPGDADQGKLCWEHFAARKIVKCRYHQTLGQIAGGTKDDQGTGTGWPGLLLGRARYQLCPRWRPDRYLVKHGGAVWWRLQSFALPRDVAHP